MFIFAQIMIIIFGIPSIYLLARKSIYGWIVGLCAEPFWFYCAIHDKNIGIFIMTTIYTIMYIYGVIKWKK